jgi:DNA polymerase-4
MLAATRLVCSVGLAPNKLCAKIASDLDKPDGLCVLEPAGILDAVGDRSARLIPGVGPRTAERLEGMGIGTIAELASADDAALDRTFGPRLGRELRARARGHDDRPVVTEREQKSESRETTFPDDVSDVGVLKATLDELADDVARGLAEGGHAGRTITLKIRLRPFRTHTRSRTIDDHTSDPDTIRAVARRLLADFELDAPVRLLGVGVANLVHTSGAARAAAGAAAAEALTLDL